MSFRDFITSRLFRRKLRAEFDDFNNIRPPANPSRRYMDGLVERLLSESQARNAHRELEMIGQPAVPSLVAALNDPRYHQEVARSSVLVEQPLDLVLQLLVPHSPADVVAAAAPLIRSSSSTIRKTAAIRLASLGLEDTVPLLAELLNDPDGFVRSYVRIGVQRALSEGRSSEGFQNRMYDLLLEQCDQNWEGDVNDAAVAAIELAPARAARDFASERWLTPSNPYVYKILEQCNQAGILLPEQLVRQLLDYSLPKAVGDRCYPHQYVAAGALVALAKRLGKEVRPLLETALNSDQEEIQEAAGKGIAELSGIDDPVSFVIDLVEAVDFEGLTIPQQTVYCANLFDVQVCNGGLMQFFGNSSGDHTVETLEALRLLGHPEASRTLERAMSLVGPLARESGREMRLAAFEDRYDELLAKFEPLENEYYRTKGLLRQRLLLFAAEHGEHFRKSTAVS